MPIWEIGTVNPGDGLPYPPRSATPGIDLEAGVRIEAPAPEVVPERRR